MEKRVLLAFALSSLVLSIWFYFFVPKPPPEQPNTGQQVVEQSKQAESAGTVDAASSQVSPPRAVSSSPDQPLREIAVETPYWHARFTNEGAVPTHWTVRRLLDGSGRQLKGHDNKDLELIPQIPEVLKTLGAPLSLVSQDPAINSILQTRRFRLNVEGNQIQIGSGDRREVVFTLADAQSQIEVSKRFTFHGDRYDFEFLVEASRQGKPFDLQLVLGPNFADQSVKETGVYLTPPIAVARHREGTVDRIPSDKTGIQPIPGPLSWAGVEDNYFALLAVDREGFREAATSSHALKERIGDKEITRHFIAVKVPVKPGMTYAVIAGPKDPGILREFDGRSGNVGLEGVINYGMFSRVVRPVVDYLLLPALNFTYRYVHNYGLAIIVITFLINMLFFPLKWKSTLKMRQAAALQPKMKALQDRIKSLKKDDPQLQALQMEQVKLMKVANPLSGCLPMFAQLPVFWAFYSLLTVSIDVRQAPFFAWIDNLSAPDRFHILPIVMCLSMIGQTAITPTAGTAVQNPSQKMMMYVMPVVLTAFFFWKAPSGLVLYWLFSNVFGVAQQLVINKLNPPTPPADASSEKKSQKKRAA